MSLFSKTFSYQTLADGSGILTTPHGAIQTPAFIFCATKAAIKGLTSKVMHECGTQIILSNTYHLMLQPGHAKIKKLGGLQHATGWNGPMLTDSGGFQVFSLGHGSVASEIKGNKQSSFKKTVLKIEEEGVEFKSYLDGSKHKLTPELSIQVQKDLGADIILVFDECTPFNVSKKYTKDSMQRSHRWGKRSLSEFNKEDDGTQKLFGIVQGGIYEDLRIESSYFVNENDFFGQAIGGSLGQTQSQMHDIVEMTMGFLRKDRHTHLLGIGGIKDIWHGVTCGVQTFDCVHPTRIARHGAALVKPKYRIDSKKEHINIKNAIFDLDLSPVEDDCDCYTCLNYSKGYIHYLLRAKELLAHQLIMIHNVRFLNKMMEDIRSSLNNPILFKELREKWGG